MIDPKNISSFLNVGVIVSNTISALKLSLTETLPVSIEIALSAIE